MTDSDTPEGLEEIIRMFTELRKPEYQQYCMTWLQI